MAKRDFKGVSQVRPDSKGRVTLGKYAKNVSSYNVSVADDGRILLEPFVEIPAREKWLFDNSEALNSVRRGLEEAAKGEVRKVGFFSKFATEDEE